MNKTSLLRFLVTAVVVVAAVLGHLLWKHYLYSPWTRDGRVRADVVKVAPDVAGLVAELRVHDNQFVHRGDVLLAIDPSRYRLALEQARANLDAAGASVQAAQANIAAATAAVAARRTDYTMYRAQATRRLQVPAGSVVSSETRDNAVATAEAAEAAWRQSGAALKQAQAAHDQALSAQAQAQVAVRNAELNLSRTQVRAPVDGYATNVQVRAGDYANAGVQQLALVDSHSYYIYGYFEETKLPQLRVGDPVDVRLMAGGLELRGRIDGIARGITDRDNAGGADQLANVNPTFNWVRLAQRIPVRIGIDPERLPAGSVLVAGMTATITVHPRADGLASRQARP
ncbi:HlyD family secretion protein [Rhodanobacter sp. PCA2]|uniref:biotin/lipoyl-binding protein n=1 Tax=Rhodanobacter sp. PCA2 TaxID=2006117 RepID=UPI0015E62E7A|nr:HlyD family secretion protein [Rhodanobacter sp. PCA2]MBA2079746.1 efflux transporter periplasmic adaptor subunit [Rhodanobacter sp. PCA2]